VFNAGFEGLNAFFRPASLLHCSIPATSRSLPASFLGYTGFTNPAEASAHPKLSEENQKTFRCELNTIDAIKNC
jgi:hypothetical protein